MERPLTRKDVERKILAHLNKAVILSHYLNETESVFESYVEGKEAELCPGVSAGNRWARNEMIEVLKKRYKVRLYDLD